MKLTNRLTNDFLQIKVDAIETIIFKDSKTEIQDTIDNLTDVLDDLHSMLNQEVVINVLDK